ncbi:hypothetical protein HYV87_05025 [Candidatus Woesearchaeota archaeon]|nr:hypothetical protein [Candidatus Woesearchaeota archaeon]
MVRYDSLQKDLADLIGKVEIAKQSEAAHTAGYVSLSLESNVAAHIQGTLRHIRDISIHSLPTKERRNTIYMRETFLKMLKTDQLYPEQLYFLWRRLYPSTISSVPQNPS